MKKYWMFIGISLFFVLTAQSQNRGDEQGMAILEKLQLPQDKVAVSDAYATWWTKSQENLDHRMEWYADAKFGCFIHWGVYSVPAGVWKGKNVGGYTEHLMRKAQIPLVNYIKELVLPFNPVDFDADEWMRTIRDAGMKYLVITAKHHDGFAMYFSDVYPYDMSLTKYNKDPMAALREAARKYGIKFGFYYSHAFDWEHPCAPGNDWEYPDHPGGDRLVGGSDWWLTRPDYLPIADKYVREKSIPQIQELIKRYDPDLMWFDTPHKLPLYQNIRILKAIREIDPENKIVVNGRLARFDDKNLGDYANTGDRAAYLYPTPGFWESIPTTNESYGYSIVDTERKPVSHFVRLLSSAVAKGGNILLNVGPMGNGKWDDKDVSIVLEIGKWLKVNGEAIYGAQKTDLPVQSWGVTTQKGDTLYAHVHQWPKNGILTVGGLTSDIGKAWLVSDPQQKRVSFSRINDKDMVVYLPVNAPDLMNTVVALTVKKAKKSYPVRLLDDTADNTLFTFDAEIMGSGLRFGDGKVHRNYVTNWKTNDQWMRWEVRINKPVNYDLFLDYNTVEDTDTGEVFFSIAGKNFTVNYPPHPEKKGTNSVHIGSIALTADEFECSLRGKNHRGNQCMNPIAVRLIKTQ
ncbi:MAG: alpha-L-fucosidase [Porphyromonadaceae bacterium]|nr:alpha-L-fucosidase [Porphyromonadaceae bacterium]